MSREDPILLLKKELIKKPDVKPACPGGACAMPSALTRVPLFAGLNDGEISLLEHSSTEEQFKSGETLIVEGDDADSLFVMMGHLFPEVAQLIFESENSMEAWEHNFTDEKPNIEIFYRSYFYAKLQGTFYMYLT